MEQVSSKKKTVDQALVYIKDECRLMYGGFGGIGSPPTLIEGIFEKGVKNLHLIGNDAAFPEVGVGRLISNGRVKSMITSHIGSNPNSGKLMSAGKLDVSFYPQGTLAEKIRCGGVGLGGILVDIGMDTIVDDGKQRVEVNGKTYMLEPALTGDVAIVYAERADEYGNLIYDKTARNFNPLVAMAADITIAEVKEIVPRGALNPEMIATPGVFVDYLVESKGVNWTWAWQEN